MSDTTDRDDGLIQYGQLLDTQEGIVRPYTQITRNFGPDGKPSSWGADNVELTPTDANASIERNFDLELTTEAALEIFISYATKIDIQPALPDVLTNLLVYYNKSIGTGEDVHTGEGRSVGERWSFGLNLPGRASSSVSIVPDVVPVIKRYNGSRVSATVYRFFLSGDVTEAQIITRLEDELSITVNPWPVFKDETFTVVMFGQQISVTADVNLQQSVSDDETNTTYTESEGVGYSVQTGVSTNHVVIPPVLHRAIVISNPTNSGTVAATASVGWTGSGGFPTKSVTSTVPTQTAIASVQPPILAATSPASVPLYGFYLYDYQVQSYLGELAKIVAVVINMNYFGPSLSALTTEHGTLVPAFFPEVTNYEINIVGVLASTTVTPTLQEAGATITVNGMATTSGTASGSISLVAGPNLITIVLTEATKATTYSIVLTRD